MSISKHGIRSLALALCAISLLSSGSALAYGEDWHAEVQVDRRIRRVLEAEKAIAKGNYIAAAASVVRMMPHIKTLQAEANRTVDCGCRARSGCHH
ncbi:MAG: hypothetical protein ABI488_14570 [Polyangiaceae bacterium]